MVHAFSTSARSLDRKAAEAVIGSRLAAVYAYYACGEDEALSS
jgi:hypothetical protein